MEEVKPQVKKYMINNVSQKLDECELFRNTFGKSFAKKRAQSNIKKVYEVMGAKYDDAEYDYKGKIIVLYNEKDRKFNVSDIRGKIKQRTSHEVGHAIMLRTEEECEDYGIEYGTGIFIKFYDGTEKNRGLNEGYNNWMLEKSGIKTSDYNILTNIIKILELATNEESIMALGTGNPTIRPQKKLEISEEEFSEISEGADKIYFLETSKKNRIDVLNVLTRYQEIEEFDGEEREQIEEDYRELTESKEYIRVFSSQRYKADVEYAGKEDTLEERIMYLEEGVVQTKAEITKEVELMLERIFGRYFQKEFDILKKSNQAEMLTPKRMGQLETLIKLVTKTRNVERSDEYTPDESVKINDFVKKSKKLSAKYTMEAIKETKQETFRKNLSDMSNYKGCYDDKTSFTKKGLKDYNRGKGFNPQKTR